MIVTIRDRIKKAIAAGKSLADIQTSKPTAEFDTERGTGYIKPAMLVDAIHKDLTTKRPQK
jgi:hypothetical protein